MKVIVNWGAKNTSGTFRVNGADLEAAGNFLNRRDEWGRFEGNIGYKWKGDGHSNAASITLTPTFTITMPSWAGYRNQPQACQDEWDAMWRALRKHEDGHREIFERALADLVSKLEAMETPTSGEVENLMKQARSDRQAESDSYDTRTDNGKSQGVELTILEQCKSKAKR